MALLKMFATILTRTRSGKWMGALLLLAICSCENLNFDRREYVSRVNEPITGYSEERDVVYGTSREYQSFDIFYPENIYNNPSDVVILIHGGNWLFGDKWFLQPSVDELKKARKNLTIVNINYRLFTTRPDEILFELQIADIDSCVNFLSRNVKKYNIRSDKFAIMGASAGGHLALSYAYTLGKSKIHTVIGMSSITELSAPELLEAGLWSDIKVMTGYQEGDPDRDLLIRASPVHLANTDAPRTILLYGALDRSVGIRQQTLLRERLLALRVPNALYVLKDQNHNIEGVHVADSILGSLGADEWDLYFESL